MKLTELLINQELIVQLVWGEQKIEFNSYVIAMDGPALFVAPYFHNGSELELNVTKNNGVVCNIFTDNPNTKQRISWKNVELTTVNRGGKIVYCIKTYGFNVMASPDDRRSHVRITIDVEGKVFDGQNEEGMVVTVHDISDIGVSFYIPESYTVASQQIVVRFEDTIDEKMFNVKVDCSVSRTSRQGDKTIVGCKILGENRDYKIYGFIKRLKEKAQIKGTVK